MADRYAPLVLPAALHQMPNGYNERIKQFGGDGELTAQQHVDWLQDFTDLEEVDEDDLKMRIFDQILKGEEKKWFRTLDQGSIANSKVFE